MIARVMVTSNGRSRPGADHGQADGRARCPAHPLDRFVERAAVEQAAVDMGDEVARLQTGAVGRRAAGRRHHLDRAVLHGDGEAEAAIIAVGGGHQAAEAALVEIGAVRIEAVEHAVDGAADQGRVVDLVDIFGLHPLEHAHELVDLTIGADVDLGQGGGRGGDEGDRADEAERAEEVVGHDVPAVVAFAGFYSHFRPAKSNGG